MQKLTIRSSNGELIANPESGHVISCKMEDDGEGLDKIIRFDLEEFKKHYNYTQESLPISIDILDLGYWYESIDDIVKYEEPAHEWRKEFRIEN